MENITLKKIAVSYVISSFIIFMLSATTSVFGLYGARFGVNGLGMSVELLTVIQLAVVLVFNLVFHMFFYFGGFELSPIAKGIGIGAVLGLTYFFVMMFALNLYNINTDPIRLLIGALSGRILEYSAGGFTAAVVSVTDIHRWGILRAF